jgi:hypothetical protein
MPGPHIFQTKTILISLYTNMHVIILFAETNFEESQFSEAFNAVVIKTRYVRTISALCIHMMFVIYHRPGAREIW